MNKKLLLSAILLICKSINANSNILEATNAQTLEELRSYARENRSDIEALREQTYQLEALEYATLAKHFPQLNISTTIQKSEKDTLPEQLLQLNLTQPIFAPTTIYLPHKLSRIATKTSTIQTKLQQNTAQLELEQSFFAVQHSDTAQKTLEETLRYALPIIIERAELLYAHGLISGTEFAQEKARYESSQTIIEQIIEGKKIATKRLELTAERTGLKDIFFCSSNEIKNAIKKVLKKDPKRLIKHSVELRPDLELLEYAAQKAELQNIIYRSSYLPTASVFATMYASKRANTTLATAEALINYPWMIGVNFSWNFDSLSNMFNARASHAEYLSQMLKKKRTQLSIQQEVDESIRILKTDQAKLKSAEKTLEYNKKAFEQKVLEFDSGLIAQAEFLTAKKTWDQARIDYSQVVTDAGKNYALYNFRTGNQEPLSSCINAAA